MDTGLQRLIKHFGSRSAMAKALGTWKSATYKWVRIPGEHVLTAWRATSGAVTPHELRPDLYPDPEYRPAITSPAEPAKAA